MRSYITSAAVQLLQNALASNQKNLNITGSQVGSNVNFIPNDSMENAQGTILVDNRQNSSSVKGTTIILHEVIYMVQLDNNYEFNQVGNILIYLNDTPFLWLVSDIPLPKQKIDFISHFAGDNYFFPCVLRFPYIANLINFDYLSRGWYAKFKSFVDNSQLIVPEQNVTDQCVIEKCSSWYADNKPVIPFRIDNEWLAAPLMFPLEGPLGFIDSGTTKAGQ